MTRLAIYKEGEASEISDEELYAAAEMYDKLVNGTFYEKQGKAHIKSNTHKEIGNGKTKIQS